MTLPQFLTDQLSPVQLVLVNDVVEQAKKYNVNMLLSPERKVPLLGDDGVLVNGYFSSIPPEFAVATGQPTNQWFEIFVHESCHFDQWLEQSPYWDDSSDDWLDNWVSNPSTYLAEATAGFKGLRDIESDCERRTIEKLAKYQIDTDLEQYARKGNAYVYFYHYFQQTGRWYTGVEPYNHPVILSVMPTIMHPVDYYDNYPVDIQQIFNEVYGR